MTYYRIYYLFLASLLLGVVQPHLLYAQDETSIPIEDVKEDTTDAQGESNGTDSIEETEDDAPETEEEAVVEATQLSYRVIARLPHRHTAFTQGLIVDGNTLIESSGGYGKSSLSKINLKNGKLLDEKMMFPHIFAEGVARIEDSLYQLSYRNGLLMIYDADTLQPQGQHQYSGEGWGLTYDGEHLIMSDGSDILKYMNREDFKEVHRISVTKNGRPLKYLNELEWVDGKIYANVWLRNKIVIIDPETGIVESYVDLKELLTEVRAKTKTGVLNGIAYNTKSKQLYVTGKNWPTLFEIKIKI